jgi:hypothetical protein
MMALTPMARRVAPAFFALLGTVLAAHADDERQGLGPPLLPTYRQECGSCHVAYPPDLLPAESWRRLMTGLPRHFGVDASLDETPAKAISNWLVEHAGIRKRMRGAPPDDRITRSAWFARMHDEVAPAVWKRPGVKSAANCGACHAQADQGDFNEHNVRIPR